LQVDAGNVIGELRSFQGLNGPPSPVMAGLPDLVQQYNDLSVSQVRNHDFMGPTEIDSKFTQGNSFLTRKRTRKSRVLACIGHMD
jgi:hypothetical protein